MSMPPPPSPRPPPVPTYELPASNLALVVVVALVASGNYQRDARVCRTRPRKPHAAGAPHVVRD